MIRYKLAMELIVLEHVTRVGHVIMSHIKFIEYITNISTRRSECTQYMLTEDNEINMLRMDTIHAHR